MRLAWIVHSAMVVSFGLSTFALPVAAEDVWTKWGGSVAESQEQAQAETIRVHAGYTHSVGVEVWNTGTTPIWNVTLRLIHAGKGFEFFLHETKAGGPAYGSYAYWPTIPVERTGLVIAGILPDAPAEQTFDIHAVAAYTDMNGEGMTSDTTLHLQVYKRGAGFHGVPETTTLWICLALVVAAGARRNRSG